MTIASTARQTAAAALQRSPPPPAPRRSPLAPVPRARRQQAEQQEEEEEEESYFSLTLSRMSDVDYLGQSTRGDLNVRREHLEAFRGKGKSTLHGPIEEIAWKEAKEAESLLNDSGIADPFSVRHSPHGIFCTRTLNLRSISAIGYDMDYTLIHYNVMAGTFMVIRTYILFVWHQPRPGKGMHMTGMANLKSMGFPVDDLDFDPNLVIRGLVMDKEIGNLVKADHLGYIKRAMHGTKMLSTRAVSKIYGRELVDLRKESRWEFLNTLFSVSEAVMFMQSEIMAMLERFVEPDPELPLALLDQKEAGKKLLLITNSDYHYTNKRMNHAFNRFLPNDMGWIDLFEMMVERSLDIHGDEILYVGDHIFTDVSQSKVHLRWRTALICRELEDEFNALIQSHAHKEKLVTLIQQKEVVDLFNQLRLALQRRTNSHPAQTLAATCMDDQELTESMQKLLIVMHRLDEKIAPMLEDDGELFNKRWGWFSRAGLWDKSHLTRQIEKHLHTMSIRIPGDKQKTWSSMSSLDIRFTTKVTRKERRKIAGYDCATVEPLNGIVNL